MTGTPASTSARTCGTTRCPPSSFTAAAPPSLRKRAAVSSACAGEDWYEPNGRSATTSARRLPRTTPRTSGSSSSTVTGTVES